MLTKYQNFILYGFIIVECIISAFAEVYTGSMYGSMFLVTASFWISKGNFLTMSWNNIAK